MRLRKSSGKVLDLSMEEGSGTTAYDASRYGNDGAVNGGAEWVEHGMRFNGSTGYLDCGNDASLDITDAITLAAWVNRSGAGNGGYNGIIGKSLVGGTYPYSLRADDATNKFVFAHYDGAVKFNVFSNVSITNDRWYHVTGVFNKIDARIYIDGVLQDKIDAYTNSLTTTVGDVYIGRYTNSYFNGSIDDALIYNRALTPLEIKHDYDATKYKYK